MEENYIKIRTIPQWFKHHNLKVPKDFKGSQYEVAINRCREYLQWLNNHACDQNARINPYIDNHRAYYPFTQLLYMLCLESVHYKEMAEARDGLDVLKDIDFKIMKPLVEDYEPNAAIVDKQNAEIIGKSFSWLQEFRNRIRNVFILLDIHLPELMRSTYNS
jgi:hypothetical protein